MGVHDAQPVGCVKLRNRSAACFRPSKKDRPKQRVYSPGDLAGTDMSGVRTTMVAVVDICRTSEELRMNLGHRWTDKAATRICCTTLYLACA